MKILNITHADCRDGSCASWLVQEAFPEDDITVMPCSYGSERAVLGVRLEGIVGQYDRVYITDFSFNCLNLLAALAVNPNVWVFDHHKTAQEELTVAIMQHPDRVFFDMDRCGAKMVLDYFVADGRINPQPTMKALVDHVEDRDLWKWEIKDSKLVNSWLRTFPMDVDSWYAIERTFFTGDWRDEAHAIRRLERLIIDAKKEQAYLSELPMPDGTREPVLFINTGVLVSEIVGELAEEGELGVAVGWFYKGETREFVYSLRSRGDVDVSEIAKFHGGGGHAKAAGFVKEGLL